MAVALISVRTGPVYAFRMNLKMNLRPPAPASAPVTTAGVVRCYIIYACNSDDFDDNDDDKTFLFKGEDPSRYSQPCSQIASLPKSQTAAHAEGNIQSLLSLLLH